jgi:hypothetical protein
MYSLCTCHGCRQLQEEVPGICSPQWRLFS